MEKCYSCEDIAERYGVKIITVWDWIRKKKLAAIKTGKMYRITPEDLRSFETSRRTMKGVQPDAHSGPADSSK